MASFDTNFRIVDSIPDYGRGMEAKRDIDSGKVIMCDTDIFMVRYGEGISEVQNLSSAYRVMAVEIIDRICTSDDGQKIENLFNKLHFIDHTAYERQDENARHISEELGKVIHECQFFLREDEYKSYATGQKIKDVVYRIKFNSCTTPVPGNIRQFLLHLPLNTCAINHSCVPNAIHKPVVHSDLTQVYWEITACRPIRKGEQVFITYLCPTDTYCMMKAARQRQLKFAWSFDCTCERCKANDNFNKEIHSKLSDYRDEINKCYKQELITSTMYPSSTASTTTSDLMTF